MPYYSEPEPELSDAEDKDMSFFPARTGECDVGIPEDESEEEGGSNGYGSWVEESEEATAKESEDNDEETDRMEA